MCVPREKCTLDCQNFRGLRCLLLANTGEHANFALMANW